VERVIQLHVERLPEGVFLATSDDVQGLVAQGRSASEAIEIAKDVARKLLESRAVMAGVPLTDSLDCQLVVPLES
jgi:predicted RNase H-like HicB family nuclease